MSENKNPDLNSTELVPIDWFDKKQEYKLFDYFLENIDFIIDDMEERNRLIALGAVITEGGKYQGNIRSTGYFNSQDDVLCKGMSIIGKSKFQGITIVDGNSRIVGRSHFLDHCLFGGKAEIAGTSKFATHILTSGKLILNGKINVDGNVYADSPIVLKGTTSFNSIRSSSSITARAQIFTNQEIIAEEFILTKGGGEVQSITAKFVSVGFKDKLTAKRFHDNLGERRNFINPVVLLKYLKNTIQHAISKGPKGSRILIVNGDINAEEIYLSNCVVYGNVKGNDITIGPNVTISGLIEYSEVFEITEKSDEEFNIKQISSKSVDTSID